MGRHGQDGHGGERESRRRGQSEWFGLVVLHGWLTTWRLVFDGQVAKKSF